MGRRSSHFEVIPLCHEHHQGNTGIHMDKKNFEKEYGTADVDIQTGIINYPKENGEADKKD